MVRESEAAARTARSSPGEIAEPEARSGPQPARWSIPRMLAVSAIISAGLWALILLAVAVVAG